jgi:predicted TIM-barrel fold metal-dependent hydrolase
MITDPLEHRRYDQSEYEPFWAAAAALDLPLSLPHTATRRHVVLSFQEDAIGIRLRDVIGTAIRGSSAATPLACTILTWRG